MTFYMPLVLSATTMISGDEYAFFMSFCMAFLNVLYIFKMLSLVLMKPSRFLSFNSENIGGECHDLRT